MASHVLDNLDEFAAQFRKCQRLALRFSVIAGIVFLCGLAVFGVVCYWLDIPGSAQPGEMSFKRATGLVCLFGFCFAIIGWLIFKFSKLYEHPGCPGCGISLLQPISATFVIATGRCPKCHEILWCKESPDSSFQTAECGTDGEGLVSRAKLAETFRHPRPFSKILRWHNLAAVVSFVVMLLVAVWWPRPFGDGGMPFPSTAVILPAILILLWGRKKTRREEAQERNVWCPACRMPLKNELLTLVTGCCTECGAAVLADPLPRHDDRLSSLHMIPHGEFRASYRQFRRWKFLPCLLGGAIAGCYLGLVTFVFGRSQTVYFALLCLTPVIQFSSMWQGFVWLRAELQCPECGHELSSHSDIVMSSGNCPYCGVHMLEKS